MPHCPLIAAGDAEHGASLSLKYFRDANNMTETAGALSVLSTLNRPEREIALGEFFDIFKDDHLVVDKWFGLHAIWPFSGCVERIEELMQHEQFKLTQPNKVRALIGSFAAMNMVQFTAPDGSGFKLVSDTIIELDAINPQVAARMAAGFKSWRVLEPGRRNLAEKTTAQNPFC